MEFSAERDDRTRRVQQPASRRWTPSQLAILSWGSLGVVAVLARAVYRLAPIAAEPIRADLLGPGHVALYALWACFMLYAEGYRGFQLRFSPRVVARAMHLAREPQPLFVLLAPLYCMAFFHATRRGLYAAWGVLFAVVGLVLIVHQMPQPWRGIIDGGVVLGLVWGAASIIAILASALRGRQPKASPELPTAG